MANRISTRTRQRAALLCHVAAAMCRQTDDAKVTVEQAEFELGPTTNRAAVNLAADAWFVALIYPGLWLTWADAYAEAEGMLREGWCPGDPVVRL